jgi:hypothetical protein
MIMMDQSKRLSEPLRWGRREKTAVAALLACLALAAVGLVVYGVSGGAPKRAGCIQITFASTLGGAEAKACGGQARRICATAQDYAHSGEQLQQACRGAGYPYVPRS